MDCGAMGAGRLTPKGGAAKVVTVRRTPDRLAGFLLSRLPGTSPEHRSVRVHPLLTRAARATGHVRGGQGTAS